MMNFKRPILIAITLTSLSLLTPYATAQERPARSVVPAEGAAGLKVEELNFGGGEVTAYVEAVRQAFTDANIVVSDDVADFTVPRMQLRNIQLHEAMELLPHVVRTPDVDGDLTGQQHLEVRAVGSVWTVRSITFARAAPPAQQARRPPDRGPETHVFSVADVLMAFTEPDVLTSVETALGLSDDEPPAELRLHEATGLLIVRGTIRQLSVVQSVVQQLKAAVEARQSGQQVIPLDEHREALRSLRDEMHDLQNMFGRQRDQSRGLEQANERLRERVRELEQLLIQSASMRRVPQEQPE